MSKEEPEHVVREVERVPDARIESLAEGGGICISGTVFDQIENKLSLGYEYWGEKKVKNIPKAVRVYQIKMDLDGPSKVKGDNKVHRIY